MVVESCDGFVPLPVAVRSYSFVTALNICRLRIDALRVWDVDGYSSPYIALERHDSRKLPTTAFV